MLFSPSLPLDVNLMSDLCVRWRTTTRSSISQSMCYKCRELQISSHLIVSKMFMSPVQIGVGI